VRPSGRPVPARSLWLAAAVGLAVAGPSVVRADQTVTLYQAYWAGLAAGQIRLSLADDGGHYRNEIAIRSEGLPHLLIGFRAAAVTEGRLAASRLPEPAHYDALYDLKKRRDRRLSMRFIAGGSGVTAERGPEDTSRKPPLDTQFRRNVLDPLSAMTAIRNELRHGKRGPFTVPVYDGARRFDVIVRPEAGTRPLLEIEATLRPIAGFKGESSDDGDPENAPRRMVLTFSNDAAMTPLSMTVTVVYMPLVVELVERCAPAARCGW